MKALTTSVYTFEKLIDGGFLYIDKTDYVYQLVEPAYGQYFLSRPRRFGKSLLISTLKAIFEGKKDLFKGLVIYDKPFDWKTYPVIHIDLGDRPNTSAEQLESSLKTAIDEVADQYNLQLKHENYAERFRELILALGKTEKVVILVDEYDKPILDNATSETVDQVRKVLESFYAVIKSTEEHQRFVLLTGVSKFSKVSVFSKLNNLTDLTMNAKFATALGYTQEELECHFSENIDTISKNKNISHEALLNQLQEWYNGYRFEDRAQTVYNPVSIGKFFMSGGKFQNYWFATGTPTFLLQIAKKQQFDFEKAINEEVSELAFEAYEIGDLKTLPLLFQTGYLTIKGTVADEFETFYRLGFPNREVESAFQAYLLDKFAGVNKEDVAVIIAKVANKLKAGNVDAFMEGMEAFFAKIPYDIQLPYEKYYQTIFFVIFRLLNLRTEAEARSNKGRIDAVVETDKYVFIFEFKLDGTAEDAIKQIKDKKYFQKYQDSGKAITLIGANFNTKERCIDNWLTKPL